MLATAAFLIALAGLPAELADDPLVLDFCRVLLEKAESERHREQGAFVVRTGQGLLYFVTWPPSEEPHHLRWHGRFPKGTVAIIHTHPSWLHDPSKPDVRTARRAGIPVYVITKSRISKTTGEESTVVVEGDWATR